MTLHDSYDPTNIFAKILNGDMPAVKVMEDDIALAFMDVFPQTNGHTLVIPKDVTARNLLEMPTPKLGAYMERVQTVARAVEKALKPDGLVVSQFNGATAGQTVFHLHFHILPRWENAPMRQHAQGEMANIDELQKYANQIQAEL